MQVTDRRGLCSVEPDMETQKAATPRRPRGRPRSRGETLIDWQDPERNARILLKIVEKEPDAVTRALAR